MSYTYGMKGAPAVGNGLGGLPSRNESSRGDVVFNVPGTYTWVVPENVTSISMVCVGAGGWSYGVYNSVNFKGGGGGALAYVNQYPVSPGEVITVQVGTATISSATDTHIKKGSTTLCHAGAGGWGTGGVVVVGSGGSGGAGGTTGNFYACAGGGGAGGYSGTGGTGGSSSTAGSAGNGGGGGGGGAASNSYMQTGAGGGGVGIYGQGANGAGGSVNNVAEPPIAGGGFSGSRKAVLNFNSLEAVERAENVTGTAVSSVGAAYGGGGGCANSASSVTTKAGAGGAARIVWGDGRRFPSTDVGPD